jgi:hypothetical protein
MWFPANHYLYESETDLGSRILVAGTSALISLVVSLSDLESSRMRTDLASAQGELPATPVYLVRATVYNESSQASRDMSFFH